MATRAAALARTMATPAWAPYPPPFPPFGQAPPAASGAMLSVPAWSQFYGAPTTVYPYAGVVAISESPMATTLPPNSFAHVRNDKIELVGKDHINHLVVLDRKQKDDEQYAMKRARNNEAVRKCRVKNKMQSIERDQALQRLQAEVDSLRGEVGALQSKLQVQDEELQRLRRHCSTCKEFSAESA